jgi:4-hydroxy-tetrahydrodipicolinate synthase
MFSGSMTALITPFRDGQLDAEAFGRLVEFQIAGGSSALVPCGSTGESATLTHQEHAEVVRLAVKYAKGRVPVIAGTGSNSTAEAIALTRAAQEAGATAALLISPYYNKPTQEGIYQHYKAIAAATRFPLIVYNIPGRTGSKIEATTIARLAEIEHIVGLKESTGSLDEVQEVIRLCGERLEIYSGDDALTLPIMAVGGVGVISVMANALPKRSAEMAAAALAGDWATARRLHYDMLPFGRVLFLETNPIPIKAAMAMMGYCRDELRLPLLPMSEAPRAKLRSVMQQMGLV